MQFDLNNLKILLETAIPHNHALGLELVSVSAGQVVMRLPYRKDLVGHPETGILHGGAITTLLDSVSGLSVHSRLGRLVPIATLDLRIDYLKPAEPDQAVYGACECYKLTRNVGFCRGFAYQDDKEDPVAHCTGSFMLDTPGGSPFKSSKKG